MQSENVHMETERMLIEQARVHEHQECCGLPLCAACRASVLLNHCLLIRKSEDFIKEQPEGTKVFLK